jgi:hypothetical protein
MAAQSTSHPLHGRVKGVAFTPGREDGECRLEVVAADGGQWVVTLLPGEEGSEVRIDGDLIQQGGFSPADAADVLAGLAYWLVHHPAEVTVHVKEQGGVLVAGRAAFKQTKKGTTP